MLYSPISVGKITEKTVWRSALLSIRHSNYSAILSKIQRVKLHSKLPCTK